MSAKKSYTILKFKEYEKDICKLLKISKKEWNILRDDIIEVAGLFDKTKTYAGYGQSGTLGDKMIPDLYDPFIYYIHDGLYTLVKENEKYKNFKSDADIYMRELMLSKASCPILPWMYYLAVTLFGWLGVL